MFDSYDVTSQGFWNEKITFSKDMESPANEIDCLNLCINVKSEECDIFVFDHGNSACHIGMLSETSGITPEFGDENSILHVLKSNFLKRFSCYVLIMFSQLSQVVAKIKIKDYLGLFL